MDTKDRPTLTGFADDASVAVEYELQATYGTDALAL